MALGRSSALNSCNIESIIFFQPSLRMLPCRWARLNTVLAAVCALLLLPNTVGRFSTDCRERTHQHSVKTLRQLYCNVFTIWLVCISTFYGVSIYFETRKTTLFTAIKFNLSSNERSGRKRTAVCRRGNPVTDLAFSEIGQFYLMQTHFNLYSFSFYTDMLCSCKFSFNSSDCDISHGALTYN